LVRFKSFRAIKLLLVLFLGVSSFQRLTPPPDTASAHFQLAQATTLVEKEKYEAAKALLLKALPVFEAVEDWDQYLIVCRRLDDCFFYQEDWQSGVSFFEEALNKAEKQKKEQILNEHLFFLLASNYHAGGSYEEAIHFYELGMPFAEMKQDTDLMSRYYGNLGILYWDAGDHSKALEVSLKSLDLTNAPEVRSAVLEGIGNTYRSLKDYPRSVNYFRQSLAINSRSAQTWIQFSKVYEEFGKIDSAFLTLKKALPFLKGNSEKADYHYQSARLYKTTQNIPKAISEIQKAISHGEKGYGTNHSEFTRIQNLAGQIYLTANNPDTALTWFHQNLLLQSEGVSKDMDLTQNPTLDQLSPGSYWVLGSLDGKGTAFYQKYKQTGLTKNLEHAITAFELALNYGEKMRLSYGHESSKAELYEYLNPAVEGGIKAATAMALKTGNPTWQEKAFEFAERVKAAIMAEALHSKDMIKHLIPDSDLQQKQDLQERIAALEIQLHSKPDSAYQDTLLETKLLLTKFESDLEKKYPHYHALKYGFQKTVDLAKIRQHLAEDALLVEYFKGDSTLYTFALSKTAFKAYTTPITADFDTTLRQYRRALSDWDYIQNFGKSAEQDFMSASPKLYEWLLAKPLSEFKAKSLVIVPDGALGLISFDALLTTPFHSDWTDLGIPYLIKKYPISYDWSAGAMVSRNREAPEAEYHFGGFGTQYDDDPKPVAMRSDLGPLPNADDEVRDIDSLLNGKSWLNAEATKDRFLNYAPRCGILHIATHGILDEENPMQSHLVFNKTSDGAENRLFASELYTMDLPAQMAVLSACNTGSGKVAAGEGNMSIARALSYAGCPTLVSNLWSANDRASAKLMVLFYEYLKTGATVDEAMRAAKLSYLQTEPGSVSLPYYWASFMVVGEPAALFPPPFNWWLLPGGLLIGAGLLYLLYRRLKKINPHKP